jgi:hypothetical protein
MAFLCVSQRGEFKNKSFFGEVHVTCQKLFVKKLRGKINPVIFFLRFFIAFLAVSLHEELKNTIKIHFNLKTKPENKIKAGT